MARETDTAQNLTNVEVVTCALGELGGADGPVHLEKIAIKAHQLAPGSFRWDLDDYADRIDKGKVRVSLTDAEKPAKGRLVRGVGASRGGKSKRTDLWHLTQEGAAWLSTNRARIQQSTGLPAPALKRGRANEVRRRLASSNLYQEFLEKRSLNYRPYDFADLLECSPDARNDVVRDRFENLRATTELLNDEALEEFLDACASAHAQMMEL